MNQRTKGTIIFVVVVIAALGVIVYFGARPQLWQSVEVKLTSTTVEGDVLAIENVSDPPRKEAVVKLTSGETVRAFVPPACVVFPGQRASLSRMQAKGTTAPFFYVFKEAKEKNDS